MGGDDHVSGNPVHITSNDFVNHHEEEVDEEDVDEVDDEHDYEIGTGIHEMIVKQTNEVEQDVNAEFLKQQHLLQQQLNQINMEGDNTKNDAANAKQIGKHDLIMIKNRNVYIPQEDDDENLEEAPVIPLDGATGAIKDTVKIVIEDNKA